MISFTVNPKNALISFDEREIKRACHFTYESMHEQTWSNI